MNTAIEQLYKFDDVGERVEETGREQRAGSFLGNYRTERIVYLSFDGAQLYAQTALLYLLEKNKRDIWECSVEIWA